MVDSRKSDEELVEDWQADKNRDACFQRLFRRHREPIANFFLNKGFSDEECRDLTQDTFIRVYRGMPSFQHNASFRTWLFQIARNLWKNALRDRQALKRAAEESSFETMVEVEGEVPPSVEQGAVSTRANAGPLAVLLVNERQQRLRDAMTELPPEQQQLVLFRIDQELKVRQIADLMNMPVGTVKTKLARARRSLKEKLGPVYPEIEL